MGLLNLIFVIETTLACSFYKSIYLHHNDLPTHGRSVLKCLNIDVGGN